MTPAPLQLGQAPSELALNSAGFTPLAFANAVRIGSSSLVYVAGLLRREPRIAAWRGGPPPVSGGAPRGGGGGGVVGPPPRTPPTPPQKQGVPPAVPAPG